MIGVTRYVSHSRGVVIPLIWLNIDGWLSLYRLHLFTADARVIKEVSFVLNI